MQQESRLGELEKHTQSLMTEQRYQSMKVQELLATLQEVSTTLQKVSTSQADFLAELASLKAETLQMEKRASAQPMRQKTVSTQPVIHLGKHEESLLQLKPMLQPEPLLQLVQPTSLQSTSIDTTKQSVQPTVNETTKQSVEDQTSAQTNQVKDGSTTQVERVSHTASFSHEWKRVGNHYELDREPPTIDSCEDFPSQHTKEIYISNMNPGIDEYRIIDCVLETSEYHATINITRRLPPNYTDLDIQLIDLQESEAAEEKALQYQSRRSHQQCSNDDRSANLPALQLPFGSNNSNEVVTAYATINAMRSANVPALQLPLGANNSNELAAAYATINAMRLANNASHPALHHPMAVNPMTTKRSIVPIDVTSATATVPMACASLSITQRKKPVHRPTKLKMAAQPKWRGFPTLHPSVMHGNASQPSTGKGSYVMKTFPQRGSSTPATQRPIKHIAKVVTSENQFPPPNLEDDWCVYHGRCRRGRQYDLSKQSVESVLTASSTAKKVTVTAVVESSHHAHASAAIPEDRTGVINVGYKCESTAIGPTELGTGVLTSTAPAEAYAHLDPSAESIIHNHPGSIQREEQSGQVIALHLYAWQLHHGSTEDILQLLKTIAPMEPTQIDDDPYSPIHGSSDTTNPRPVSPTTTTSVPGEEEGTYWDVPFASGREDGTTTAAIRAETQRMLSLGVIAPVNPNEPDQVSRSTMRSIRFLTQKALNSMDANGAYLKVSPESKGVATHMTIDPRATELLVSLDPTYRDFLQPDGLVCVWPTKAPHDLVEAELQYEPIKRLDGMSVKTKTNDDIINFAGTPQNKSCSAHTMVQRPPHQTPNRAGEATCDTNVAQNEATARSNLPRQNYPVIPNLTLLTYNPTPTNHSSPLVIKYNSDDVIGGEVSSEVEKLIVRCPVRTSEVEKLAALYPVRTSIGQHDNTVTNSAVADMDAIQPHEQDDTPSQVCNKNNDVNTRPTASTIIPPTIATEIKERLGVHPSVTRATTDKRNRAINPERQQLIASKDLTELNVPPVTTKPDMSSMSHHNHNATARAELVFSGIPKAPRVTDATVHTNTDRATAHTISDPTRHSHSDEPSHNTTSVTRGTVHTPVSARPWNKLVTIQEDKGELGVQVDIIRSPTSQNQLSENNDLTATTLTQIPDVYKHHAPDQLESATDNRYAHNDKVAHDMLKAVNDPSRLTADNGAHRSMVTSNQYITVPGHLDNSSPQHVTHESPKYASITTPSADAEPAAPSDVVAEETRPYNHYIDKGEKGATSSSHIDTQPVSLEELTKAYPSTPHVKKLMVPQHRISHPLPATAIHQQLSHNSAGSMNSMVRKLGVRNNTPIDEQGSGVQGQYLVVIDESATSDTWIDTGDQRINITSCPPPSRLSRQAV